MTPSIIIILTLSTIAALSIGGWKAAIHTLAICAILYATAVLTLSL